MIAMLFAAGLGTRFRPWTDKHPKALAVVNGKTLLQRNIEYLQQYDITGVVVNVHHFPEQIIDEIEKNKGWGSTITISDESDELMDTGVFDEDRYFDVYTEYAKADMDDMCIRITVHNRGPETSTIHLIPTIWFRNFWSFLEDPYRPSISADKNKSLLVEHKDWGLYNLYYEGKPDLLFCDNETNHELVYGHAPTEGYWKDGINFHVVNGKPTVNPELKGTKAALRYALTIEPGQSKEIRLRLSDQPTQNAFEDFEFIFKSRIKEADVFYDELAE